MNIKKVFLFVSVIAVALLYSSEAFSADYTVEDGQYIVRYSAFNSTTLTPKIAKAYNLMRSRERAVMNITVQRKMPDGSNRAVVSQLKGFAHALGGSEQQLDFRMVNEGDAIYYLAEFLVGNGEKLDFDISVKPTPDHKPLKVEFTQAFFPD